MPTGVTLLDVATQGLSAAGLNCVKDTPLGLGGLRTVGFPVQTPVLSKDMGYLKARLSHLKALGEGNQGDFGYCGCV